MARKYIYTCDGCDRTRETTSDDIPQSWAELSVGINGLTNWVAGGGASEHFYPLLCPTCQIVLVDRANPSKWVRADKQGGT